MHTGTIEPLDEDGRARGPLVLVMVHREDGSQAFRCSDRVVYDVDPETATCSTSQRIRMKSRLGLPLPGVRVPGLDRAEA
jgi:hypothetical protein